MSKPVKAPTLSRTYKRGSRQSSSNLARQFHELQQLRKMLQIAQCGRVQEPTRCAARVKKPTMERPREALDDQL
jgi:hypothetical protein